MLLLSVAIGSAGSGGASAEEPAQQIPEARETGRRDSAGIEKLVIGARAGINDNRNEERFTKYEFFGNYTLPWVWRSRSGWILAPKIDLTAAALHAAGTTGFIGSLGPAFTVTKQGCRLMIEIGISPAYLGEDRYGREDLSGHIQFLTHGGVSLRILRSLSIGYEFQHISNADIQQPNPGLNVHNIQVGYSFW
jgi:hypothetical protein